MKHFLQPDVSSCRLIVSNENVLRWTDLPPALVSLTVPGFGTLGVAQVFFMTRHLLPVSATPALLLHLLQRHRAGLSVCVSVHTCVCVCDRCVRVRDLSAGFAAPSVTPH